MREPSIRQAEVRSSKWGVEALSVPVMWPIAQVFLLGVLLAAGACQKNNETTEENRPYEFGFVIDGEQHRYEKKDEKGIIMGEYGFITADGVYHVTVYATDEDGNFIILKTRNIRIGLKMMNLPLPTGSTTTTTSATTTTKRPAIRKLSGQQGCSGCLIPDPTDFKENSPPKNTPLQSQMPEKPIAPSTMFEPPFQKDGYKNPDVITNANLKPGLRPFKNPSPTYKEVHNQKVPGSNNFLTNPPTNNHINPSSNAGIPPTSGSKGVNEPNPINEVHQTPSTPTDINIQVQKESPIVPESLTKPILTNTEMKILDFMARLYKFNYILSYHGHEEEGDIEGNKRGSYFNNGRDGYQRKVAYIANEFGYQPMITLEKLNPSETPNEKTEKELTQLKGSEFIWFYDKIKH